MSKIKYKIIEQCSRIKVTPKIEKDTEEYKKLQWQLGVFDEIYHKYRYVLINNDMEENSSFLPKFYGLYNYLKFLTVWEYPLKNFVPNKYNTCNFNFNQSIKLRNDQIPAYDALSIFMEKKDTGFLLEMSPGKGKTVIALKAMCDSKLATIIFVPQIHLISQWIESIQKFTDIPENDICIIKGRGKIDTSKKVFISTYKTFSLYSSTEIDDLLSNQLKIGLKIFDEANNELQTLFIIDSSTNIKKSIYLSATPNRTHQKEDVLLQYILPSSNNRYVDIYEEAELRYQYLCLLDYKTTPNTKDLIDIESNASFGFDVNNWGNYMLRPENWEILSTSLKNFLKNVYKTKKRKTIICVKRIKMIKILYQDLINFFPDMTIGKIDSSTPKKKRTTELSNDIVILTEKSATYGLDIPKLQLLINTVPFSSAVIAKQLIGRLRRIEGEKVVYVDMVDLSFKTCRLQRKNRITALSPIVKQIYKLP
jgi:superfamily II DNA or RNA helicase